MSTFQLTIDGKVCSANQGETILTVATRNGIEIPTPLLPSFGSNLRGLRHLSCRSRWKSEVASRLRHRGARRHGSKYKKPPGGDKAEIGIGASSFRSSRRLSPSLCRGVSCSYRLSRICGVDCQRGI